MDEEIKSGNSRKLVVLLLLIFFAALVISLKPRLTGYSVLDAQNSSLNPAKNPLDNNLIKENNLTDGASKNNDENIYKFNKDDIEIEFDKSNLNDFESISYENKIAHIKTKKNFVAKIKIKNNQKGIFSSRAPVYYRQDESENWAYLEDANLEDNFWVFNVSHFTDYSVGFPGVVIPSDYVAYYKLDNETGGITPDEGGIYNATVSGAVFNSTGGHDGSGAYKFSGDCSALEIPDLPFDTEATISMWLKNEKNIPSIEESTGLMSMTADGNVLHYPYTDGVMYINTFRDDRLDISGGFDRSKWHMLTIVTRPGVDGWVMYQNDTQIYNTTGESQVYTTPGSNLIGTSICPYSYNGSIDSIIIYNRSLSSAEIQGLYEVHSNYTSLEDCLLSTSGNADRCIIAQENYSETINGTYIFYNNSIGVFANNITIDCNNSYWYGDGTLHWYYTDVGFNNITLSNCKQQGYDIGYVLLGDTIILDNIEVNSSISQSISANIVNNLVINNSFLRGKVLLNDVISATLQNVFIDDDNSQNPTIDTTAGTQGVVLDNITLANNVNGYGILPQSSDVDITVRNSLINDTINAGQIQINNSIIRTSDNYLIGIPTTPSNIYVKNSILDCQSSPYSGITFTDLSNLTMEGNVIENCTYGIETTNTYTMPNGWEDRIKILNNHFSNNNGSIKINANSDYFTEIVNNTLRSLKQQELNYDHYTTNTPRNYNSQDYDYNSGTHYLWLPSPNIQEVTADDTALDQLFDGTENLSLCMVHITFPADLHLTGFGRMSEFSDAQNYSDWCTGVGYTCSCDYFRTDFILANGATSDYTVLTDTNLTAVSGYTNPHTIKYVSSPSFYNLYDSANATIQNNTFFSNTTLPYEVYIKNSNFTINHLLSNGVSNAGGNSFCINNEGNFYLENLTVPSGDCGQANVTYPVNETYYNNTINVTWKKQSSFSTVNYDIFLNNLSDISKTFIANTTNLFYLWSRGALSQGNYSILLVPWISGSRYNATNAYSSNFTVSGISVTSCRVLNDSDMLYTLANSVNSTSTCFNVTANHVTLDGGGFTINYSSSGTAGYGVYVSKFNFTTIENAVIIEGNSVTSSKHAVYFVNSSYGLVYNNTIKTIGGASWGIVLTTSSNYNNILGNNVTSIGGSNMRGMGTTTNSQYNNITNNLVAVSSSGAIGIYPNSNFNSLINNTVTAAARIGIQTGDTNIVMENNTVIVTSGTGFNIVSAYNNLTRNEANATTGVPFSVVSAGHNIFSANKGTSTNTYAYLFYGATADEYNNTLDSTNLADGKAVNYTYNIQNAVYDSLDYTTSGEVIFAWCRNITISNSNFSNDGLNLFYTNESFVNHNSFTNAKSSPLFLYSLSNYNNITNNNFVTALGVDQVIYLTSNASFNLIHNNTIRISGPNFLDGIVLLTNAKNNIISNNEINTSTTSSDGIVISSSSDNSKIINNRIRTSGTTAFGINLVTSNNNYLDGNIVNTTGTGYALVISGINTTILNSRFTTNNTATALYVSGGGNITASDSLFSASGTATDLYFANLSKGIINFTNVTFADYTYESNASENLNIFWYLNAYANYPNRASASGVNITSWNNLGTQAFSVLTNSTGNILRQILQQSTQNNATNITSYSNYTFNATLTGYTNFTQLWNMTTNRNLIFTFGDPPSLSSVLLNSTTGNNLTDDNLTAYPSGISDPNGDNVSINYNWFRNGTSDTVLNMPMTAPNASNVTYDFSGLNNHGTVVNATFNATGGYDGFGAYVFDGDADYITIPSQTLNTSGISFSWWNKNSNNVTRAIFSKGSNSVSWIYFTVTGILVFESNTDVDACTALYTIDTNWHHYVITTNGSGICSFYEDGTALSMTDNTINDKIIISRIGTGGGANTFNGTIDDIRIYNRSLSANEILFLYQNNTNTTISDITTQGDIWSVKATPIDSYGLNGSSVLSNNVTILNSAPTQPTLINPAAAEVITNRTPYFNWTASTDEDNDSITYNLLADNDSDFSSPTLNITQNGTNYTPPSDIYFATYFWMVVASDGILENSSTTENFTLIMSVSCSLPRSSIDFGQISLNEAKNTTGDSPPSLIVQNNGNVKLNISVNSTDLWGSMPNPSSYYQFEIGQNETGAYTSTLTSWNNFTKTIPLLSIVDLKYPDSADDARIDVLVRSPPDEGAGNKSSSVEVWCESDE